MGSILRPSKHSKQHSAIINDILTFQVRLILITRNVSNSQYFAMVSEMQAMKNAREIVSLCMMLISLGLDGRTPETKLL